jgi:hypothetical protein
MTDTRQQQASLTRARPAGSGAPQALAGGAAPPRSAPSRMRCLALSRARPRTGATGGVPAAALGRAHPHPQPGGLRASKLA